MSLHDVLKHSLEKICIAQFICFGKSLKNFGNNSYTNSSLKDNRPERYLNKTKFGLECRFFFIGEKKNRR